MGLDRPLDKREALLHWAANVGQFETIKQLLEEKKVDIDVRNDDGMTPLMVAVRQRHAHVALYLVAQGADITAMSDVPVGQTVLHLAAQEGMTDIVRMALGKGADPDVRMMANGYTALHYAALYGDIPSVSHLLAAGANPNIKCQKGMTPLAVNQSRLPLMYDLHVLIKAHGGYFVPHEDEGGNFDYQQDLKTLEALTPHIQRFRRVERLMSGLEQEDKTSDLRRVFLQNYPHSTRLMRAAMKENFPKVLNLMEKASVADLIQKNEHEISALDILRRHNKLSGLFKAVDFWMRTNSIEKFMDEHLTPFERKKYADDFKNLKVALVLKKRAPSSHGLKRRPKP